MEPSGLRISRDLINERSLNVGHGIGRTVRRPAWGKYAFQVFENIGSSERLCRGIATSTNGKDRLLRGLLSFSVWSAHDPLVALSGCSRSWDGLQLVYLRQSEGERTHFWEEGVVRRPPP